MPTRSSEHFGGDLQGKTIAVWGLAFKPRTDDIREAPALVLIDRLLEQGAKVPVHDPEAMENVAADLRRQARLLPAAAMDALEGADALAIMTEWKDFHSPGLRRDVPAACSRPVIFDGRNLYEPERMKRRGLHLLQHRPPGGVTRSRCGSPHNLL